MKRAPFSLEIKDDDEKFDIKSSLFKYLHFWPWFIIGILFCGIVGLVYLKYASVVFDSVAKIKIVDDSKRLDINLDPIKMMNSTSLINLDNEIEVLQSYRLLSEVVKDLNLDISYFVVGKIKNTKTWDAPFVVTKTLFIDSITKQQKYDIELTPKGFHISDLEGQTYTSDYLVSDLNLPFDIQIQSGVDVKDYQEMRFRVELNPVKDVVIQLVEDMNIKATNKSSEIISLSLKGQNPMINENILNTLIERFNEDGVRDRQLISKRTVDFIDERFENLSGELNLIEGKKEDFKESSNLSYIEADASMSMQKKAVAEDEVNKLQTQVSLSELLKESLSFEGEFELLPADIGLESSGINNMVSNYNQTALKRQKLVASAGENNPTLQSLSEELIRGRKNILRTVNVYQKQLNVSLEQLTRQRNIAGAQFSRIPQKEKVLRSIERQQSIKENLYLLLLQKREEAAINYAVTAPSIKVVDYALTNNEPVSPNKKLVYGISILMGFLMPFGLLYMRFSLDSKIRSREDLERLKLEIPIAAEMPEFKGEKIFSDAEGTSILAESYRILSTNVNYLLSKKEKNIGQVIYVTSSVKGEGKTLTAVNLSLAYASLKKKVLLVGADFRNPQIHTYFNQDKDIKGLSNYLHQPETNWKDYLFTDKTNEFHSILFSGAIPPNVPALFSKPEFEGFIEDAKTQFDYIVVDTAPALLVTDTMLISPYADLTLMLVRAGFSDKSLLEFSKSMSQTKKLKNMVYVINAVPYQRNNSYNYGYGYGYRASGKSKSWYRFMS